jgi:intracellular sulfur oxidation DsrE/DsrF family protein
MRQHFVFLACLMFAGSLSAADWPAPVAPVIPEADGYVAIPNAAIPPEKTRTYRAIYDGTQAAETPAQLLPVLNMVGSELNAFAVAGVPLSHAKFVVVFHGAALDGILNNEQYRAKFGTDNPNLRVLTELRKAGVRLYVCGQNLVFAKIDPATISPDVVLASDALIVLMRYQNDGYALLSF